jgi:hypothetical protein
VHRAPAEAQLRTDDQQGRVLAARGSEQPLRRIAETETELRSRRDTGVGCDSCKFAGRGDQVASGLELRRSVCDLRLDVDQRRWLGVNEDEAATAALSQLRSESDNCLLGARILDTADDDRQRLN